MTPARRPDPLFGQAPRLKVLYFGTYERDYPRNAQVISCLRRADIDVAERHEPVWESTPHKWRAGGRTAPAS